MPTYQYACTACRHQLEAVQSFTDAALTDCPACAGRLRKLFSAVGIVFKGSGFYRNDSRSGAATSESDAGAASISGKETDSTAETKSSGSTDSSDGSATTSSESASSTSDSKPNTSKSSTSKSGASKPSTAAATSAA